MVTVTAEVEIEEKKTNEPVFLVGLGTRKVVMKTSEGYIVIHSGSDPECIVGRPPPSPPFADDLENDFFSPLNGTLTITQKVD